MDRPFAFTVGSTIQAHCLACKTIRRLADGSIETTQYQGDYLWRLHPCEASFEEMARGLRAMALRRRLMIMMGAPVGGIDLGKPQRRLWASTTAPNTLCAVPRRWLALDIDHCICPAPLGRPERLLDAAAWFRATVLPDEFRQARCIVSPSASSGMRGETELRCRLWFTLDRPVPLEALRRWALGCQMAELPIDPAPMMPGQPIYCARPRFIGMTDPLLPEQYAMIIDGNDHVALDVERYQPRLEAADDWARSARAGAGEDWLGLLDATLGGPQSFFQPLSTALGIAARSPLAEAEIVAACLALVQERADPARLRSYDAAWVRRSIRAFRNRDRRAEAETRRRQAALFGESHHAWPNQA